MMNEKSHRPLPEPIQQLQKQLDEFRLTHARRSKLPEALWQAAVALARQYGLYTVAHSLRLDYAGLQKRCTGTSSRTEPKVAKPGAEKATFVELSTPRRSREECVIEFVSFRQGCVE